MRFSLVINAPPITPSKHIQVLRCRVLGEFLCFLSEKSVGTLIKVDFKVRSSSKHKNFFYLLTFFLSFFPHLFYLCTYNAYPFFLGVNKFCLISLLQRRKIYGAHNSRQEKLYSSTILSLPSNVEIHVGHVHKSP